MEKSGFYKETVDGWYYAPNGVSSPDYDLEKELKDTYNYPIDGWFWSDVEPTNYIDIFITNENNNLI